jgi:hypothetical protein
MEITNIYEVYFSIALYPNGVQSIDCEYKQDEVYGTIYCEFVNNFDKYLCTQNQSNSVLQFLRE